MGLRYVGGPWPTQRYRVFLDGVEATSMKVFAADDREGYLVRLKRTPDTNAFHLDAKGRIPVEVVHGTVRIDVVPA